MLALLLRLALTLSPAPAPSAVVAHAIPGAVVFDLDRGEQWTVAIDDDGLVLATTIDRARGRSPVGGRAPALPAQIERIDASADGTTIIVHGAGRTLDIALAPA